MSKIGLKETYETKLINAGCSEQQSSKQLALTEASEKIQDPWQKVTTNQVNINLRSPWKIG